MSDFALLRDTEISLFNFTPPGPVSQGFIDCNDGIAGIMGPWGSGKTTTAIFKGAVQTLRMPVCKDGVIRARGCIMRDNFRTLYRTTLESWFKFFPRDFPGATFEGGQDRPAKHSIRFTTPSGRRIEMIVDFYALGDHAIEELLKGYEPSWGACDELDLFQRKVPTWLYGRTGRYPSRDMLADPDAHRPRHVWGAFNPPVIGHWLYEDLEEDPKEGFHFFRQPSGLTDQAENRAGTTRTYYEEMARTMRPDEVRRFVHGDWGHVVGGAPVYPEFAYDRHVPRVAHEPVDGIPLAIGADAGGSPAAVFRQQMPNGQVRWLSELCADPGTGPGRFAEMLVDHLMTFYRGIPIRAGWGDPSAFYGNDRAAGELSWMEIIGKAMSRPMLPAPSNDPGVRQDAVAGLLRRRIDGQTEAFQVNPGCKMLVGGLMGNYRFGLNAHETLGARPSPVKNKYSHPHDAGQYVELGERGLAGVINDAARAGRPGNVVTLGSAKRGGSDFSVWDV
jgi:hypothetical protein